MACLQALCLGADGKRTVGSVMQRSKRKFDRGPHPCRYCQDGDHRDCRGVLCDASALCSCSCPEAVAMHVRKLKSDKRRWLVGKPPRPLAELARERRFNFKVIEPVLAD